MKSDQIEAKQNQTEKSNMRSSVRWMMVFYDIVIYIVCSILVFTLHPSMEEPLPTSTSFLYIALGALLFFGFRALFRCYRCILRYANIGVFARELFSTFLGGGILITIAMVLTKKFGLAPVRFIFITAFVGLYIVTCLLVRFIYCYLYYFAEKEYPLSPLLKKLLTNFAFVDFDSEKPGAILHLVLEPEKDQRTPINDLQNIVDQFAIRGEVTAIEQINKGYINRTYHVKTLSERGHVHQYTLQRINTNVFPDVVALMDNFKITTNHLFGRLDLPGKHERGSVQTFRPTKDGRAFLTNDSGCWRMLTYFDGVYSMDIPSRPDTFYHAGRAFGKFIREMADVPIDQIKEVIPNFHNTQSRYLDLEASIERDPKGRVKSVAKEIAFIRARSNRFSMISDALESGKIPTRICHNDCNLNNILFDEKTHLPVAIIDLDTVMPSSPLYDFGDSMRIGTNTAKDDEKDLSKVSCDLSLYEQYARGYLEACGDTLTKEELALLPYAALIITAEDGIRFLMDHIDGDTYYTIYYPGQNLDRSRTQLKLLEDMEAKLPQIKKILQSIYNELGLDAKVDEQ